MLSSMLSSPVQQAADGPIAVVLMNPDLLFQCLSLLQLRSLARAMRAARVFATTGAPLLSVSNAPIGDEQLHLKRAGSASTGWEIGVPLSLTGAPPTVAVPEYRFGFALQTSLMGQALEIAPPLERSSEWTVCCWSLFEGGSITRPGFEQPVGWRRGEHALFCSSGDDQPVFYSEDRGPLLGSYIEGYGFAPSAYSFEDLTDGWHHVAAAGDTETVSFVVDGHHCGTTHVSLEDRSLEGHNVIAVIGNVVSPPPRNPTPSHVAPRTVGAPRIHALSHTRR